MRLLVFSLVLLASTFCVAQTRILLENKYFRVSSVVISESQTFTFSPKRNPILVVAFSDLKLGSDQSLNAEGAQFWKRGSADVTLASKATKGEFALVEFMQDYDSVELCGAPKQCGRAIRSGELEVGKTTFVMGGGGLTVQRHALVEGASLTSNYYTSHIKSHVLLVAFTGLDADFGGDQQDVRAGQVYFTNAEQLDITAGKGGARWVAIRVLGN